MARPAGRRANSALFSLHYVQSGSGSLGFVMLPPNPMDQTSWLFQTAHLSTWFRTLAVDLPGYGHSAPIQRPVTMAELADAVWKAADKAGIGRAVLAGVSIGAGLALHMVRRQPMRSVALIMSGCSYTVTKPWAAMRINGYRREGIRYRERHLREGHSPAFLRTALGRYLGRVAADRADLINVETIIRLYEAHGSADPADLFDVPCPTLIVSGSKDYAHTEALALYHRIVGAEMVVLEGAGHVCNLEQPQRWDEVVLEFLHRRTTALA